MESWYFTPKIGISCSIGQINFGNSPEEVKNILGTTCHNMTQNAGETGCSIRLEYDYQNKLVYILFCEGSLIFEDMEIFITTKPQLKRYLKKKGFPIKKYNILNWESCPELCITFASSKDNGGETNIIGSIGLYYGEEYWDQSK